MENRKSNTFCSYCKSPIYRRPRDIKNSKTGVYCGRKCYGMGIRNEHPCIICKKAILASAHKQTCSKECELANYKRPGRLHSTGRKRIGIGKDRSTTTRSFRKYYFMRHSPNCKLCGYDAHIDVLNIHHILERSNGGGNEDENLIALCPTCHTEVHKGYKKIIESC